ncbi:MAG: hypothetical protein IT204_24075 [Fimbriimonadaceae bacterium]|nr:hypothetical protein [Fimbriimonadaceae bacterium]
MSFLRKLFGPSRDEIWQQLCAETGARFVAGGFWNGSKVEATHEAWTITLDTYTVSTGKSSVTYTRLRAPYVNPEGFRFSIQRAGLLTGVAKWFGMQDLEIGDPGFDEGYVIKGTDEQRVRQLFANANLRALVAAQPDLVLSVQDHEGYFATHYPPDTDVLLYVVVGVITDLARLKLLFDLFAEVLDTLCTIGAAYETPPNVDLR